MTPLRTSQIVILLIAGATAAHAAPRNRLAAGSDVKADYEKAIKLAKVARAAPGPKPTLGTLTKLETKLKHGVRRVVWEADMSEIELRKSFEPSGKEATTGFFKEHDHVFFRRRLDGSIVRTAKATYYTGPNRDASKHPIEFTEETIQAADGTTSSTTTVAITIHALRKNVSEPAFVKLTRVNDRPIEADFNFRYSSVRASLNSEITPILAIIEGLGEGIGAPMAEAFRSAMKTPLHR